MFRTRLLTAILVLPPAAVLMALGGLWFFALVTIILTVAVIEFCRLMRRDQLCPAPAFAVALLWVLMLDVQFPDWKPLGQRLLEPGISIVLMGSLAWQLAHRGGKPTADWALSMAGPLYIGWCGVHFIRLRNLPGGVWWVLVVLAAVWLADIGAYFVGRMWGRHKLAPTLSPSKTWEGWAGGVVVGGLATTGLAALLGLQAGLSGLNAAAGLVMGLVVGAVAPLGDLVISMFKRQAGAKNTGMLFPGHGGALDRVDSALWAAVIGYYLALWLRSW